MLLQMKCPRGITATRGTTSCAALLLSI
jgi:hypothetical protein